MKRILLLSDTHGFFDERVVKHAKEVDQIWHAGDVGDLDVCDQLLKLCPSLKVVWGNIDDSRLRAECKKDLVFDCEGIKVWITHIGGYPPKYRDDIKKVIDDQKVKLFVCGHSHILKVIYDKDLDCLHLNPGAIGKHGFHQVQTALKFEIHGHEIKNMHILEFPKRAR